MSGLDWAIAWRGAVICLALWAAIRIARKEPKE
jgi:hypothetical protein